MPVPTNRVAGQTIDHADINAIAALSNANETASGDENIQDKAAALLTSGVHTNVTATYQDAATPPRVDLSSSVTVHDQGAAGAPATAFNFTGSGVSTSVASGFATVTVPGPVNDPTVLHYVTYEQGSPEPTNVPDGYLILELEP